MLTYMYCNNDYDNINLNSTQICPLFCNHKALAKVEEMPLATCRQGKMMVSAFLGIQVG